MKNDLKWDIRFLQLAEMVASWSKDPSTKCGAVIVDNLRRVVSVGFNGFAKNVRDLDNRLNNRDVKLKIVIHAETNAILFAKRDLTNCTIYTWPFGPCGACSSNIIQSGISVVKYPVCEDIERYKRWEHDLLLGETIRKESGVKEVKFLISKLKSRGQWHE